MNWYYVDTAGQQAGPVDDAGLDALLASGKINVNTLVWKDGMANWQSFREVRPTAVPVGAGAPRVASGIEEAVCAECGGIFPVNDTIRVGSARVCANCKPIFVQKMQEGMNVDTPGTYHYAGFWIRFVAVFVDGLILGAFQIALNIAVFGLGALTPGHTQTLSFLYVALSLFQWAVAISYETFFIGKYGATLGKMACKIHVVVADGSQMSYARALGRYFSKIVSYIICLIGFIMAGFDDEKRALHDRMCNTRVVYK